MNEKMQTDLHLSFVRQVSQASLTPLAPGGNAWLSGLPSVVRMPCRRGFAFPVFRFRDWCLLLVLGCMVACFETRAAEIPDTMVKLLLAEFDREVQRNLATPHEDAVRALREKYKGALRQEMEKEAGSGVLERVLPYKREMELLDNGGAIPATVDDLPAGLARLRKLFLEGERKVTRERDAKLPGLLQRYDSAFAEIQASLTKEKRIDDALAVKELRESLGQRSGAGRKPPVTPETGAPPELVVENELSKPNADGWIVLYENGRLHGCSPDAEALKSGRIALEDGALRLDDIGIEFEVKARDVAVRAILKRLSGQNLSLQCRIRENGGVSGWLHGEKTFGSSRHVDGGWSNFGNAVEGERFQDFFEMTVVADGRKWEIGANGNVLLKLDNEEIRQSGNVVIHALKGVSLFKKVEVKILP